MLWTQKEYIDRVSDQLERISCSENTYNFKCPFCGDSKRKQSKRRGYLYVKGDTYRFFCHNCQKSIGFYEFLYEMDSELATQYRMACLSETVQQGSGPAFQNKRSCNVDILGDRSVLVPLLELPRMDSVVGYVRSRSIPLKHWGRLYAAPNGLTFLAKAIPKYADRVYDDGPRLVLPICSEDHDVLALTCRAIDPNAKTRYLTLKLRDDVDLIFGLDYVKFSEHVYITEGPIDSLFLPNALAATGLQLHRAANLVKAGGATFVLDNQPRNRDVCRAMMSVVRAGHIIYVWPEDVTAKDLNELVLQGMSLDDVREMVDQNSVRGLEAEIKVRQWKKCHID